MKSVVSTFALLGVGILALLFAAPGQAAQTELPCEFRCSATLDAKRLDFLTAHFPDGTTCQVQHNFTAGNGSCRLEAGNCVRNTSCSWQYGVICTGSGCANTATGTVGWNGVVFPVPVIVPCGQTQVLPNILCGQRAAVMNVFAAPTANPNEQLQIKFNGLTCASCN